MKLISLAALLTAAAFPALAQSKSCGPLPAEFDGLAFAGDGDTLYGVGYTPPIRLWGVQAAELRDKKTGIETPAGMRGRAALEELLSATDHRLKCEPRKWDRFCRVVATCTAGNVDVAFELIRGGMAYGFWLSDTQPSQAGRSVEYARAEAEARKQGRGLWKEWLAEKQ
ncbi:MAG: thermonuclease family protein [Proteobacteria bacterium]|nr:thermonuclease family protein [Pseudomonadota bacterium]